MRIHIRESSRFAWLAAIKMRTNAVAIVYGNTIHLWGVSRGQFLLNKAWLAHEVEHVRQFNCYGTLAFTGRYVWEWLKSGYYNNRFEIEARAAEQKWEGLQGIEFV